MPIYSKKIMILLVHKVDELESEQDFQDSINESVLQSNNYIYIKAIKKSVKFKII